jgi:hypothetical protein
MTIKQMWVVGIARKEEMRTTHRQVDNDHRVCGFLLEWNTEDSSNNNMKKEHIERSKRELERALEDFPPPDNSSRRKDKIRS